MSDNEHPHQNNLIIPERLPNGRFPRVKMWNPPKERPKPVASKVAQVSAGLRENRLSGRDKVQMERKCRLCSSNKDLTRHHMVPLSWFFSDEGAPFRSIRNANANIVPLCEDCHRIVDGIRDPVGRLQKRAALREALGPNEVAFILQVIGQEWFDEMYPREP